MEAVKGLPAFVLILLMSGMILAVGVLILDKFGAATETTSSATNESVTLSSGSVSVTNQYKVLTLNYFGNTTNNTILNPALIGDRVNLSSSGLLTTRGFADTKYNVSYGYTVNSTTSRVMNDVVLAVSPIATTWMGLIVTVAVLAIILTLVIASFVNKRE